MLKKLNMYDKMIVYKVIVEGNEFMKKISKIFMAFILLASYVIPFVNVVALSYGEGTKLLKMDIVNSLGFKVESATVNSYAWKDGNDEFHTNNNQYHVVIEVSGTEATGTKVPRIQYGGNWSDYITPSTQVNNGKYTFVLDINNGSDQDFLGLEILEQEGQQNPGMPGPGENDRFDGKAYLVWSCGNSICYHYFDNIPNFDDGNSTFYKDTDVTADNKSNVKFDVNAKYKGWYTADEFTEWQNLYEVATGKKINWDTLDPELILGAPNQNIGALENAAIKAGKCVKPAEDAPASDHQEFEKCINRYGAEANHEIWTHQLQPVGEPQYKNAYVSYGDRNFKVVIYNSDYKGVSIGSLDELTYYPSEWTNPFIKRDQYDISGTSKENPTGINTILLEKIVKIKEINVNNFSIKSIEALDVPADAVSISKVNGEWRLEFSSNFYDNVVFKATDTKGGVSYFQVKRTTIDGWIPFINNHPVLNADFFFENTKSYKDFELTALIEYKDGSEKQVKLEAVKGIDDGLGNITKEYEVAEGKGLKKSSFQYQLEDGEDREIKMVYFNAEYKGSTKTTYAGSYAGSGKGVPANIYVPEEEEA